VGGGEVAFKGNGMWGSRLILLLGGGGGCVRGRSPMKKVFQQFLGEKKDICED